jgi:hypothetical protein
MENYNFMIDQLLDQWENKIQETTDLFIAIGEQFAMEPVAPGKNRVIYLLGHLIVASDCFLAALEPDARRYPEYDELFLTPQHHANEYPAYELLLQQWVSINEVLFAYLRQLSPADWKSKHNYISETDFIFEPKRNKFNVLLNRNAHLFHHAGQLALIRIK